MGAGKSYKSVTVVRIESLASDDMNVFVGLAQAMGYDLKSAARGLNAQRPQHVHQNKSPQHSSCCGLLHVDL